MNKIGIGVVGYGYWGPNIVRNFAECPGADMRHVVDFSADRRALAQSRYPALTTSAAYADMLADSTVNAVIIATPTDTHFELAMQALAAGKHVLVEKPMTDNVADAETLIAEAARRKLTLQVDHTFIYTPAIRRVREMIAAGELGDVLYYDSTRINLGLFQNKIDVIWDLAVHDLSILFYLVEARPVRVSATGMSHFPGSPMNIAFLTLFFDDTLLAHVNVNWLAPVKIRRTIIGGSRKMVVYDDLETTEKIRVYDKGVTFTNDPEQVEQMRIAYRVGDMWAPNIPGDEALRLEAAHFVECVRSGRMPDTDGRMGLDVVRVLEAASTSMAANGVPIDLSPA